MSDKMIPPELILRLREWLDYDGCAFFIMLEEEYGGKSPHVVWVDGTGSTRVPHPVHFREGMQVRNFMRSTGLCEGWTDHDYDNLWGQAIRMAIGQEPEIHAAHDKE